jgi:hypothetical protein
MLAEKPDAGAQVTMRNWLMKEKGDLALESLWGLYASGGWIERDYDNVGTHANEFVRAWAIRFLVDDGEIPDHTRSELLSTARTEQSVHVLSVSIWANSSADRTGLTQKRRLCIMYPLLPPTSVP